MRTLLVVTVLMTPSSLLAAELQVHRDLAYANSQDSHQTLDVYAPKGGKDCPVIVWIHGGGWRQGDKAGVHNKPQAFADKGFVFVSINYRFVPEVTIKQMIGDVAKAIRWVHDHAREYGGDPNAIYRHGPLRRRAPGGTGLHGRPLPQGRGADAVDPQRLRAGRRGRLRYPQATRGHAGPPAQRSWPSSVTPRNRSGKCRRSRMSPRARTSRRS